MANEAAERLRHAQTPSGRGLALVLANREDGSTNQALLDYWHERIWNIEAEERSRVIAEIRDEARRLRMDAPWLMRTLDAVEADR